MRGRTHILPLADVESFFDGSALEVFLMPGGMGGHLGDVFLHTADLENSLVCFLRMSRSSASSQPWRFVFRGSFDAERHRPVLDSDGCPSLSKVPCVEFGG